MKNNQKSIADQFDLETKIAILDKATIACGLNSDAYPDDHNLEVLKNTFNTFLSIISPKDSPCELGRMSVSHNWCRAHALSNNLACFLKNRINACAGALCIMLFYKGQIHIPNKTFTGQSLVFHIKKSLRNMGLKIKPTKRVAALLCHLFLPHVGDKERAK